VIPGPVSLSQNSKNGRSTRYCCGYLMRVSREVYLTPEPCVPRRPRADGLLAKPLFDPFPSLAAMFRLDRPPTLANRVHSLMPRFLSEAPSPVLPSGGMPESPARVPSLFAIRSVGVHLTRGIPTRDMFRPQAFSTSRRFTPPTDLRAYFIPLPRTGFLARPGVSPASQLSGLVTLRGPHGVDDLLLTGKPAATSGHLTFEAFLRVAIRSSGSFFRLTRARSPPRVSSSSRLSLPHPRSGPPNLPLMAFFLGP